MKNSDDPYTHVLTKTEEDCPYVMLRESSTKKILEFERLINQPKVQIKDVNLTKRKLKLCYMKANGEPENND
jgi:hypothetical protein